MLTLFVFFIYALCMKKGITWAQFLLLFIFFGRGCAHCIIGVQVRNLNLWDFPLFLVIPSLNNCPSVRSAIVTNSDCSDFDSFRNETTNITFSKIWFWFWFPVIRNPSRFLSKFFVLCVFVSCVTFYCSFSLFSYVVLFMSLATWLLTHHINEKELNCYY